MFLCIYWHVCLIYPELSMGKFVLVVIVIFLSCITFQRSFHHWFGEDIGIYSECAKRVEARFPSVPSIAEALGGRTGDTSIGHWALSFVRVLSRVKTSRRAAGSILQPRLEIRRPRLYRQWRRRHQISARSGEIKGTWNFHCGSTRHRQGMLQTSVKIADLRSPHRCCFCPTQKSCFSARCGNLSITTTAARIRGSN